MFFVKKESVMSYRSVWIIRNYIFLVLIIYFMIFGKSLRET